MGDVSMGGPGNSTSTATADRSPMTEQLIRRALNQAKSLGHEDLRKALLLATSSPYLITLLEPPPADIASSQENGPGSRRETMCTGLITKALMDVAPFGAPGSCTSVATAEALPMTGQLGSRALNQADGPGSERGVMRPALYKAATSGKADCLLQLLQDPMESGYHAYGLSPLSEVTAEKNLAADLGHTKLAAEACCIERFLLTKENSRAGPGGERGVMRPDFYKAATSGDTASLRRLLQDPVESGFHANGLCPLSEVVTAEKNTVLHLAAGFGHTQLAEEAYRIERSLLTAENSRGDTPLHSAARAGHHCVVSLFLRLAGNGASELVMKKNRFGDTALHEAVRNGHREVVEKLKNAAPRLVKLDNEAGVSPLYLAVMNESIPLVESLIRSDNASFAGPNGQTALHAAVLSNRKIASMLLDWKPAIAQEVDASRSTPLHYAASGDDTKIVQMLLNASTSATYSRDTEGFSPIHVAARVGNVKTIKLLLETCPDSTELLDSRGRNFLHLAVEKGKTEVVKHVLKHGKEFEKLINEQDFEGNTPLHLAVESERSHIVLALTGYRRIQTSIMNKKGQTPLELASKITRILPLALIVFTLTCSGAPFSVRRRDKVQPWNKVDRKRYDNLPQKKGYDNVPENMALVSSLIAMVAFSATFNVPGGYNSSDGKATLHGQRRFTSFMYFDSMAIGFALVSLILFIHARPEVPHVRWILTAGFSAMWLAIVFMSAAFTVAAISVGMGKGIWYVACAFFYSPIICMTYLVGPKVMALGARWLVRRPCRAKQQFNDAFVLVTGLVLILILLCLSALPITIIPLL